VALGQNRGALGRNLGLKPPAYCPAQGAGIAPGLHPRNHETWLARAIFQGAHTPLQW
jgi:hypothetical protein